jgi:uncharacterized protein
MEACMTETPNVTDNTVYLLRLAKTKMPFGKYQGRYLIDLPEAYLVWFSQKGFPEGELGSMLQAIYEIKINGLEHMVRKIKNF